MNHSPETDEMAGYRPVSPLAVAAAVGGAASGLVLVTPLAAMLPLLGVALAAAALADLRLAEGKRAGRPLALVGLALALGFAAQAAATTLVDGWIARQRATAAATAWIEAVREGRLADAMGMCGPGAFSLPHDVIAGPEPPTVAIREAAFVAVPAVVAVTNCAEIRPTLGVARRSIAGDGSWVVWADLAACGGSAETLRLEVGPRTVTGPQGIVERWLVKTLGVDP